MSALAATIIDEESGLDSICERWDALAVETSKPFCAPAWMLAWWRNARPEAAGLCVVTITEGDRLVGLAPLWANRRSGPGCAYEVLTARLSPPVGPLAVPGREREVAEALTRALATARPKPLLLHLWSRLGSGDVPDRLAEAWPGRRPWRHAEPPNPVPVVSLDGLDYDEWFASRSSKFRQESRRLRRRLEDAGGNFTLAGPDDVDRSLSAFIELHDARWKGRGGSNALIPGLRAMLVEAAAELLPSGRLRIFTIEVEGRVIAANLLVAAGEEVSGWNSGFDEHWSRYSPSLQLTLHALADATERGDRRMSLGPGDTDYKRRLADTQDEIANLTLVPRGVAYPMTRLRLVPYQARWSLSRRLSAESKRRLRRLARR